MKKLSLLIVIVIAAISCNKKQNPESSPNDDKSISRKSGTVHQLRLLDNDLLVGEYDVTTGTVTVVNLSNFIGSTFDDLDIPANTYTVSSVKISHNNFNQFYLEYIGTNGTVGNIRVGIPLYVGTRENPDGNFINCPKETHTCNGGTSCECCIFNKSSTTGCIIGCTCNNVVSNPIGDQCIGTDGKCGHTVTTSTRYADDVEVEADDSTS